MIGAGLLYRWLLSVFMIRSFVFFILPYVDNIDIMFVFVVMV